MQNSYTQEDEIDLSALFNTIYKNKFKLLFFSLFVTSLAMVYVLITPNSYTSKTILIPKNQEQPNIGAGAAALASMAGVNLGSNNGMINIGALFKDLIHDYAFTKKIIEKYHLSEKLDSENMQKNMVYVMHGDIMRNDIISLFTSKKKEKEREELLFKTFQTLKDVITTSTDEKTGAITLSCTLQDRFLAKELVSIYLKEMSEYIKKLDLKEIDEQVNYYDNELSKVSSIELKANIIELLSALVKKKVLSQAGEFYMVKQLTKPEASYIKDKSKPKRALILVIAMLTSLLLGIFLILMRESL